MITYITAFIDINRNSWSNFNRTFEDYFKAFEPFLKLFDSKMCDSDNMIVFIDDNYYSILENKINNTNIRLIPITTNNLPKWKYIEKESEIMKNQKFIELLGNRTKFPEHNYPEYTLINHSKIDLVCKAIDEYEKTNEYFAWVDFGFFSKSENIPSRLLDINNLDKDKINYSLINPIETKDSDIYYSLKYAPEVIGGFWFFGSKEKMKMYQEIYMKTFLQFQEMGIADDDQHIALQCYFNNKELFSLKQIYGWHKVLKRYQKKPLKVISFCLWGNEKRYVIGLYRNIELAKLYYPDWICYLYIHISSMNDELSSNLNKYDNIRIIVKTDKEIRNKRFMLWRFEPILLYPMVEYFISRDIDTRIQPKEVLAVDEWIESGKTLHIMRDHPQHYPRILGGMYGIKCKNLFKENWIEIIEDFYRLNGEQTDDQYFLYKYIYENVSSEDRMIHDEIKKYEGDECKMYPLKFEKNGHFIGCYIYEDDSTDIQTSNVIKNWLNYNAHDRIYDSFITIEEKMKFIQSKISNIYVMHYTKLVSRKKNMIKELKRNLLDKFFKIKWIENFDRETLEPEKIQNECILNPLVLNRRMTLGEIANGMAHKYIYQQILENDEIAIVLEDDTIFKPHFINHLYHILNNLPNDWDMICLGGPIVENEVPAKSVEGSIKNIFESKEIIFHRPSTPAPCTLSCMLHCKKGVEKILSSQYIQKLTAPSDHNMWACNLDTNAVMYWIQPWISFEGSKTDLFNTSLDRGF
jgi:GR25 family glycosyltransferase involved in LPS biosynthesis